MAAKTLLTVEDFEKLEPQEGVRFELDEGELVTMTFPKPEHNFIIQRIYDRLGPFVKQHRLGRVIFPDTGYVLSREPSTVRGPDLTFIRKDRLVRVDVKKNIPFGPDLAVEVISPNDRPADVIRKTKQYLRAGTHTVWLVYGGDRREVEVHDATGSRSFTADQTLRCPELLPGFEVQVRAFFEDQD